MKTLLTAAQTMEILGTTVPRLEQLVSGVPAEDLAAVTRYGWSVGQQLAHLRSCHDILGGNMLRIVREDHPAWRARSPRSNQGRYMDDPFAVAFAAFRSQRAELLEVLEAVPSEAWNRTATVTEPPGRVVEHDVLYYGDWMARHERSHLGHMRAILEALAQG